MLRVTSRLGLRRLAARNVHFYDNPLEKYFAILGVRPGVTDKELMQAFEDRCKNMSITIGKNGIENQVL